MVKCEPNHILTGCRTGLGLSQRQFAELLGISQGFVCQLERGEKTPGWEKSKFIAQMLGKDVELLFPRYKR